MEKEAVKQLRNHSRQPLESAGLTANLRLSKGNLDYAKLNPGMMNPLLKKPFV